MTVIQYPRGSASRCRFHRKHLVRIKGVGFVEALRFGEDGKDEDRGCCKNCGARIGEHHDLKCPRLVCPKCGDFLKDCTCAYIIETFTPIPEIRKKIQDYQRDIPNMSEFEKIAAEYELEEYQQLLTDIENGIFPEP